MEKDIERIIAEDNERMKRYHYEPNPITGEGYFGEREKIEIDDFPIPVQLVPKRMLKIPFVKHLVKHGSIENFLYEVMEEENTEDARDTVVQQFIRYRIRYDFPFFAALFLYIKAKGGGRDILFRLTRPQRRLVNRFMELYEAKKPIRIILLKARQLGGSTLIQLFMLWMQITQEYGLNSLIIAHQSIASDEILDMFNKAATQLPSWILHKLGEQYKANESTFVNVGHSGAIKRVPQRDCKIKVGTAERPDSCRGGDYNLIHLSEVGLWKTTDGKSPEDIVQSACSGVLYKHRTMIVYESTAKGVGNFFHREFLAAFEGKSQFEAIVICWYDIDLYVLPFADDKERESFARSMYEHRNETEASSEREECGQYIYWLWQKGATLEAINWYIAERRKYSDHARMASEYPSDYIEAFSFSGEIVFDRHQVEELRHTCKTPRAVGDIVADANEGAKALSNVRFSEERKGGLAIWEYPEIFNDNTVVTDRYLTVVDIGGRSSKADWSVIVVFDRFAMQWGGKPEVVAQWYGHIDMDILAWKAAQISRYYDNAELVIESNTLETHDRERMVDGDQSGYILNRIKDYYPNLYARDQSEEEILQNAPKKYGFHTNTATKPIVVSALQRAVRERLYVERDGRCLDEMISYERKPNGAFGAILGCHDDLLMTRAIGMHICFSKMPLPKIVDKTRYVEEVFQHEIPGKNIDNEKR